MEQSINLLFVAIIILMVCYGFKDYNYPYKNIIGLCIIIIESIILIAAIEFMDKK